MATLPSPRSVEELNDFSPVCIGPMTFRIPRPHAFVFRITELQEQHLERPVPLPTHTTPRAMFWGASIDALQALGLDSECSTNSFLPAAQTAATNKTYGSDELGYWKNDCEADNETPKKSLPYISHTSISSFRFFVSIVCHLARRAIINQCPPSDLDYG